MNLKPVSKEEVINERMKMTPLEGIIAEFKKMDVDLAEIENFNHKDALSCASSLKVACKRMNCGVTAMVIGGKPYLVKEGVL